MKTLNDDDHAFILDFLLVGGKQTGHGQAWLAVHRAFNFDKYLTLLIKYYTSWCNHGARKEERLRAVVCWLLDSFKICVIKPRYCPPIIAIGADTRSYNNVKNFLTHSTSGRGMARQLGSSAPQTAVSGLWRLPVIVAGQKCRTTVVNCS